MVMKKIVVLSAILFFTICFSQTKVTDTITRTATIGYDLKGNQVSLKPQTPPLIQMAGAPTANYTYFWEFGDGHFSKEKEPKHTYKKAGEKTVRLSVTNNYDNGKPPATRPKKIAVNEITDTNFKNIASIEEHQGLFLQKNREPVPEEEIVVVMSYQNLKEYTTNGRLYLFYNDRQFKNNNFEFIEARVHNEEMEIKAENIAMADDFDNHESYLASNGDIFYKNIKPIEDREDLEFTLEESKTLYRNSKVYEFENLDAGETRNIFFSLKTTPEMIKDTSATLTIRSVFVPDRNYKNHKVKNLEMEIVTSHDPNKMSSNGFLMNYRLVRFKTLSFKIRFQNDGEGPARTIKLETDVPEMFDKSTFKIVDMYPKCEICPKDEIVNYSCLDTVMLKNQIHFTFKNIYLPGTNQKNVTEKDSTKGFVKYSMKFSKDFHKQKTKSRTSIIFDKNEPIITNYAVTRFMPGISVGVRAGYNYYTDQPNPKSYFLGATISPFKSYRFYWQSEMYFSYSETSLSSSSNLRFSQFDPPIITANGQAYETGFTGTENQMETISKNIDIVPISLRYNINNYIGVGVGPQISAIISQKTTTNQSTVFYAPVFESNEPTPGEEIVGARQTTSETTETKTFEKYRTQVFADITFGFSRIGPSVGIRYMMDFKQDFNYWQFYAIWKF